MSDVGLAGWGVARAQPVAGWEDGPVGRDTHPAHACIIVTLIIVAVLQLVFDPDDTRPTTRPSSRRRIGLSGSGRSRPPTPLCKVKHATTTSLPVRPATRPTALTDADRMMAAGISLSVQQADDGLTDIFFPTCACVSGEHVGDRCARLLT